MKEILIKLREALNSRPHDEAFFCNRLEDDLNMHDTERQKVLDHLWPIAVELGAIEECSEYAWGKSIKEDCNNEYKQWKLRILDTAIERL